MKICHLTSVHNSHDTRIFYKECTFLSNLGNEVYLVATGESRNENNVKVIGVGPKARNRILRILFTTRKVYMSALKTNADIYHIHDPELLLYALNLKKHNKKVIFDSHENILEYFESKDYIPKLIKSTVVKLLNKYLHKTLSKLNGLISVTPFICTKLKQLNSNTLLITNYPSTKEVLFESTKRKKQICFTGSISKQWNLETALNAIKDIDDIKLILCGNFENDKYKTSLQKRPEWNKCYYLGRLPHNDVLRVQSTSMVGIALLNYSKNTNNNEGTLGNTKLFEYLASGLPIICTNFLLWREIIEKYNCGM